MSYVFISYSSLNQKQSDEMLQVLKSAGFQTWRAPENIPSDSNYSKEVSSAIRNCGCFMLMLTKNAQNSIWVETELERAKNCAKPIIAIQLENFSLNTAFEGYLSETTTVDLSEINSSDAQMQTVFGFLEKYLGQRSAAAAKTSAPVITETPAIQTNTQAKQPVTAPPPASNIKVIKYDGGDVYEGPMVNGKRHGKGKYTWANGDFYEGDYVDGVRTGYGRYQWKNGEYYEGEFFNNKFHGKGKRVWLDGDVYEGDYAENKRHGKGKYSWPNGDIYDGDFVDDVRTGYGKYMFANGDVYQGEFADGKRNGIGKFTHADGRVDIGFFENGKLSSF